MRCVKRRQNRFRAFDLRNPICIVPNGLDPPKLRPNVKHSVHERVPDNAEILVFLGRLQEGA
jgi:hypothetical protein